MAHQRETCSAVATTPPTHSRPVNTFIVRRWPPDSAGTHYEVAHVQSGRRTVVADLPAASVWMGGVTATPAVEEPE